MKGTLAVLNQMVESRIITQTVSDDLDVIVDFDFLPKDTPTTLAPIYAYLKEHGYSTFKHEGVDIEGWTVQFLPVANSLDQEALAHAQTVSVALAGSSIMVKILRPEYIVATALRVGRPKDMTRIISFLEEQAVDLSKLCDVIKRFGLTTLWQRFLLRVNMHNPCEPSS